MVDPARLRRPLERLAAETAELREGRLRFRTAIASATSRGRAPAEALMVEVGGVEPPSPGDRPGLLRAQPVVGSRLGAPTGGAPLGQSGFGVRSRPPGGAVSVSLLTTPDPRSQAPRGGRLPSY